MEITIGAPDDIDAIRNLLRAAHLPDEDITPDHLTDFLFAKDDARIVGAVGFERYGASGLLRSLVVHAKFRGAGLGVQLTEAIISRAAKARLRELVLLTTTAKEFFQRIGFAVITREEMPDAVKTSTEFTSLCPSTATCMRKSLVGYRHATRGSI